VEVQVTDVLVRGLVPYARFLEVRARRLHGVADVTPPDPERPIVAAASAPSASDERAREAVRVLARGPAAGVQE
jgi:hypothetical protein